MSDPSSSDIVMQNKKAELLLKVSPIKIGHKL